MSISEELPNKRGDKPRKDRTRDDGKARERKLTDDGVTDQFFRCLHQKDELNLGLSINIPDTIFYKFGQPVEWYFTNQRGNLKKKNKQNLLNARIEETFNREVLGYDVLAVFYKFSPNIDNDTGQFGPTEVQYFDRFHLNDFLYKGNKDIYGILQRFIEPKGTRNEMIRAVWSPKVCLLERAENIHELHDERYGMYERCITYEGSEYYYSLAPLRGPVLAGQIQAICENIAAHLGAITYGEQIMSRMTLNFKVDSRDKIWLLYSSSIRVVDMSIDARSKEFSGHTIERPLLNIDSCVLLPPSVNLSPKKSYSTIVPKKRILCLSCAKESLEDLRYPITYKSIMKHYEHVLHLAIKINGFAYKTKIINWPPGREILDAAGGVGFAILNLNKEEGVHEGKFRLDMAQPLDASELRIPPIIRHIHPKLNAKNYASCHKDPLFIYKTVNVCESCYLVYAEFSTMLLKLGQNLNRLLEPDQKAVDELKDYENTKSELSKSASQRPSSSDWRSMSSVKVASDSGSLAPSPIHFKPSSNHAHAKEVAVGLIRSNEATRGGPPGLPPRVRDASDLSWYNDNSSSNSSSSIDMFSPIKTPKSMQILSQSEAFGGGRSPIPDKVNYEESVQQMIRDREQNFFKEVTRNPNLKDQHPLMHLITAQQKLKLADESGGVMATKAAMKAENVFGNTYGKQSQDKFNKYGAYTEEIPYIMHGRIVLPSVLQKQKDELREKQVAAFKERQARRKARREAQALDAENAEADERNQDDMKIEKATLSAKEHRAYLQEAIAYVESETSEIGNKDLSPPRLRGNPLGRHNLAPTSVITRIDIASPFADASQSPSKISTLQGIKKKDFVNGNGNGNFQLNSDNVAGGSPLGPLLPPDLDSLRPGTSTSTMTPSIIDRPSTTAQGIRGRSGSPTKISRG